MKKDIESREDIELLVKSFYDKVKTDETIGYIFNDIFKVNWEKHFPVMFDFWENVLFFTGGYDGNPLQIHQYINKAVPLTAAHFNQWNKLFAQTVDELFEGSKATLAKQRAFSISTVMQIKILKDNLVNQVKE
jgi:hemoglobin